MQALLTTAAALLDADSQNSGTLRAIMGHVEAANLSWLGVQVESEGLIL
jgi:hypothetical protein